MKRLVLLCGLAPLLGAVAQLWVPPGATAVVYGTLAAAVAVLGACAFSRRLLQVVGGFRLASVVLVQLAVASAAGTVVLQNKPPELYRDQYGGVAALVLALRLDDLFHSVWFGALVGLMVAGLVASAWLRWPITRRNAGFFAVHLGILVVLAGTGLSALFSVKGRIDLRVGGSPATTVELTRNGARTGEVLPLGAAIELRDFDVDHYAEQMRIALYAPSKKGELELKTVFETEAGVRHRLKGGASFRVKEYYPDLKVEEHVAGGSDSGPAALRVTVDGEERWLFDGERGRAARRDGKVAVLFGWQAPKASLDAPLHRVSLGGAEAKEAKAVRIGETVRLADGVEVKALRFLPHFNFDIEKREALSLSDAPVNPALEVEVGGQKRWLFANRPGQGHEAEGPALSYLFEPEGGAVAATVLAVSGSEAIVRVRGADGTERTEPLRDGLEVEGVRFGPLHAHARVERRYATASQKPNKPAALLAITEDGVEREALLMGGARGALPVGDLALTLGPRGDEVKAFRSRVGVTGAGAPGEAIIAVNDPLTLPNGWTLYQTDYDPKDPSYSGLEAVRDPGVSWVFAGFIVMFLGVVYRSYLQPRMRRKEP